MNSNILNSKKFKTLKNIVLTFQGKELLVYPYPIFISPYLHHSRLKEDEEKEVSFNYKGKSLHIYFSECNELPMFLYTKWPKLEFVEKDIEVDSDDSFRFKLSEESYPFYFVSFMSGLQISIYSLFLYKLYTEMFDQSQKIMKNMSEDRENFFEGIGDIVVDISESPYLEEFKEARECLKISLIQFTNTFIDIQEFYGAQTYKYGLQECKSILQTHLSENSPFGYSGVDENFFKRYDHRLQLALIFEYHQSFLSRFSTGIYGLQYDLLNRINLWNTQPLSSNVPIYYFDVVSEWYVRTLHQKLRLFFKT